jgi:simple sugar transport system ATP-binding protein
MGRKLEEMPRLLIALNPAKDLDFQSTDFLYNKFIEFQKIGGTIFFISVNLDALLNLCDRIYVIKQGKILDEFSNFTKDTKHQIGRLMVEAIV